MFESLDEQMQHDEAATSTKGERYLRWLLVAVLAVVLFGGLWMSVRLLS